MSLLGDTLLEPEKISAVDEDWVVPKIELFEGVWMYALLPEVADFEPNRLPPGNSVCF